VLSCYSCLRAYGHLTILIFLRDVAQEDDFQLVTHPQLQYLRLKAEDHPEFPIFNLFESTCQHMDTVLKTNPKHKVLVHCAAGISRSATMAIAFALYHAWANKKIIPLVARVHDYIRRARDVICPNLGFGTPLKCSALNASLQCSALIFRLDSQAIVSMAAQIVTNGHLLLW
jgi:protein-tyrosine phosphatase